MRDIPLDEFATSSDGKSDDGDTNGPPDETQLDSPSTEESPSDKMGEAATTESDTEAKTEPAPPTATVVWSPEGGDCTDCGATVDRRWEDDGTLVCAACKSW